MREISSSTGSTMPYLSVTYSGGIDSSSPIDGFVPYSGVTSYKEGPRTFFTSLADISGIDTSATGAPHLHLSLNNQSYTAYKATTIGTCGSTSTDCKFRVTTPDLSYGDYVEYQAFQTVLLHQYGYQPNWWLWYAKHIKCSSSTLVPDWDPANQVPR